MPQSAFINAVRRLRRIGSIHPFFIVI